MVRRPGRPAVFAICIAVIGSASWLRFRYFADDAFISLRYVRHLAHGEGYVYNLGERVEGATNLLWVLLLVPFEWLHVDLVFAASALGIVCAAGATCIAFEQASSRTYLGGWATLVFCAVQPDFACWAGAGLEGPLVALLGMLILQGSDAGLFGGLSFAARPDGILTILATSARRRRDLLWLIAIVGGITAFRLIYFHALVPNSASAKLTPSTHQWLQGFRYLASFQASGNTGLMLFALIGGVAHRSDRMVRGALLWIGAQLLFCVLVGGDGLAMHRFFVPIVPALAMLAALGVVATTDRVIATSKNPGKEAYGGVAFAGILLVALALLSSDGGVRSPFTQRDAEIPRWTAAGRWLKANAGTDDRIAAAPIGALGYFSERPILDLLGLTDAHIAHVAMDPAIDRPGHQRHDGAYVLNRRPAFILLGNIDVSATAQVPRPYAWERDIDSDPRLRRDYQVCSAKLPGDMVFNFWHRRDRGACPGGSTPT